MLRPMQCETGLAGVSPAVCLGLDVRASHGVQWVREAAKWRAAAQVASVEGKGAHPSTGQLHTKETAMYGARMCLRHAQHARTRHLETHDRPCASQGLRSYRARSPYGWIMVGASDDADAMAEARRSTPSPYGLERWDGVQYRACA